MALITIGAYSVPDPSINTYTVTREPVVELRLNARRIMIGEFVRYRHSISWGYNSLSAADYEAIVDAINDGVAGLYNPVAITFWDPDTDADIIGNFIASPTTAKLFRKITTADYQNVYLELIEQ